MGKKGGGGFFNGEPPQEEKNSNSFFKGKEVLLRTKAVQTQEGETSEQLSQ